jgi:hypothetical protein
LISYTLASFSPSIESEASRHAEELSRASEDMLSSFQNRPSVKSASIHYLLKIFYASSFFEEKATLLVVRLDQDA